MFSCGQADFYFFAYLYMQRIAQVIHFERIAAPFRRYDRLNLKRAALYLQSCESAYNSQPTARHTGYMQPLVSFIVVVVQVEAGSV